MIYFREERWLRVNGATRVSAYIVADDRTREDVMWSMELRYIAGGVLWRRVRGWHRPWLWMQVSSFAAPRTSWVDLEHANFWNVDAGHGDEWQSARRGGYFDANYYPHQGSQTQEEIPIADCNWRVVSRDGRWFTVELAALSDRYLRLADLLSEQPALVTANGEEEGAAAVPAEFWKKNADIYLLESVPFGTVTVRTPRNARDPFRYAFARAQELIGGLPAPELSEVLPMSEPKPEQLGLHDDLFVEMDFLGIYEN